MVFSIKSVLLEKYYKIISIGNDFTFFRINDPEFIKLTVRFFPSGVSNIYHCEFGPLNLTTDEIDTSFRLKDNRYREIIFVVAYILYSFVKKDSMCLVKFSGLNEARMRLFLIWIVSNWEWVSDRSILYGYNCFGKWEVYVKNNRYGAIYNTIVFSDRCLS